MPDPTIPELVARLRELHEKATPGPWSTNHRGGDISARIRGHEVQVALACGQGAMWDERDDAAAIMRANAELIAELRSALPAILDALDHVGDAAAHWKPGPPSGRGNWWIYWRHLDDSWHVDSCEVSPSLLRYYDPDAPLLLKLPHGACFPFDTAKEQISHHAPMERPEPPKLRRGRMRARAERDRQRRRPA